MQEEIGIMRRHRGIGLHAAVIRVDTKTLARRVGRPDETHAPLDRRRGSETPDDGLAHAIDVGEIGEAQAIEDGLIGRKAGDEPLRREIIAGQCGDRLELAGIGETLGRRDLDMQASRPVAPRPDDARCLIDIARLDAMADDGPRSRAAQGRHRQHAGG
jgi:hypothetical protein